MLVDQSHSRYTFSFVSVVSMIFYNEIICNNTIISYIATQNITLKLIATKD